MFFSSTLLALVLATPDAEAANIPKIKNIRARDLTQNGTGGGVGYRVIITTGGTSSAVEADITSDSGSESVDLTESDAWLHGAATIKALPTVDADLVLTLYDTGSESLMTFSGALAADGSVTLSAGKSYFDIEVLAAEVFPNADGGYDVSFDLSGADAYEIACADVRIDELSGGTCDKLTGCTVGTISTTKAEVDFDAIGAVWEGELSLDHEGEIEIDATSYDVDGKKLEKSTVTLGHFLHTVQDSFASGHTMLSAGDGGSVATYFEEVADGQAYQGLVVISDNWTATTAPTHASVELEGGETLTIPANSFQRPGFAALDIKASEVVYVGLVIGGGNLTLNDSSTLSISDLAAPVCVNGTCVALSTNEKGTLDLSATAYASSAEKVASSATIGIVGYDKAGRKVASTSTKVAFDTAVGVVFANEVSFSADPLGLDLAGAVSLLGAADTKGKQKTLASGNFYGSFVRTEGGELALGGVDKNDIQAKGDILIGGEPIDFELTDVNHDGVIEAPPVVFLRVDSNGKGTRQIATASTGSPGLL